VQASAEFDQVICIRSRSVLFERS